MKKIHRMLFKCCCGRVGELLAMIETKKKYEKTASSWKKIWKNCVILFTIEIVYANCWSANLEHYCNELTHAHHSDERCQNWKICIIHISHSNEFKLHAIRNHFWPYWRKKKIINKHRLLFHRFSAGFGHSKTIITTKA